MAYSGTRRTPPGSPVIPPDGKTRVDQHVPVSESDGGGGEDQYDTFASIYERQKAEGLRVADMLKDLQSEADAIVKIPPTALGSRCTAAYLLSDAVVLTFDLCRNMVSTPLRRLPVDEIVAVADACVPELRRSISEKRVLETRKINSLGRVVRDLEATQVELNQLISKIQASETGPLGQLEVEATPELSRKGKKGSLDVDKEVLAAVEKSLGMLGEDGRQVVIELLEKRYGLKWKDIPQHSRAFVDLLDGLVGDGGRVVEDAIVAELSSVRPNNRRPLHEVVSSMNESAAARSSESMRVYHQETRGEANDGVPQVGAEQETASSVAKPAESVPATPASEISTTGASLGNPMPGNEVVAPPAISQGGRRKEPAPT